MRGQHARHGARAAAAGAVLALLAAGCQTTRPDQVVTSPGGEEVVALDTYDARLLDLRLAPAAAALSRLRAELDRTAAAPGTSRRMQARVDALRAEAALAAGDAAAARRLVDAAAALADAEEGVWIVRAALESDPAKRLAVLERGLAAADTTARLSCERGEALLAAGRYAEAAQDLDEGLRGLDPSYARLYGPGPGQGADPRAGGAGLRQRFRGNVRARAGRGARGPPDHEDHGREDAAGQPPPVVAFA